MGFPVVDLEPAPGPPVGQPAPTFERPLVTAECWEDRTLTDVAGDRTVLVFTPMVGSFVARYLWQAVLERGWPDRDVELVGISASTPYGISRFVDDHRIDCGIFADPGNGIARSYGLTHDLDGMAGLEEPRPAVVVLGPDRAVEDWWAAREWPSFPPYEDLEEAF